jgi:hypothetical protein
MLLQTQARADHVTFSYNSSISPETFSLPDSVQLITSPSVGTAKASQPFGPGFATEITAFTYQMSGPIGSKMLSVHAPIDWLLSLTDKASGQSAKLDIAGTLGGFVGFNFAAVGVSFEEPPPGHLGDHLYLIEPILAHIASLDKAPGGAFSVIVIVTGPNGAPEPSGLVLAATALGLACCRWLGRRDHPRHGRKALFLGGVRKLLLLKSPPHAML